MRAIVVFSIDTYMTLICDKDGFKLSGKQFTNKKSSVQPKIPRDFCLLLLVNIWMWTLTIF